MISDRYWLWLILKWYNKYVLNKFWWHQSMANHRYHSNTKVPMWSHTDQYCTILTCSIELHIKTSVQFRNCKAKADWFPRSYFLLCLNKRTIDKEEMLELIESRSVIGQLSQVRCSHWWILTTFSAPNTVQSDLVHNPQVPF